jgi:hypothetical protein
MMYDYYIVQNPHVEYVAEQKDFYNKGVWNIRLLKTSNEKLGID